MPAAWADHRFMGRAVLPAVEAMGMLAECAEQFDPGLKVRRIQAAVFEKFLEIPAGKRSLSAYCDLARRADGRVEASLVTRMKSGAAGLTRTKVHARAVFSFRKASGGWGHPSMDLTDVTRGDGFLVDPARIYAELVPFGPAYRNIRQPLAVSEKGALARIQAPMDERGGKGPLGSPFVLDAAFHAACVWGQRFAGMVAFPVGIDDRRILKPATAGESYTCRVFPVRIQPALLVFDLWILDAEGRTREAALGVHMRDVSGGRLKPPQWVMAVAEGINE